VFTIALRAATCSFAFVAISVVAAPVQAQGPPVTFNSRVVNTAADPIPVTGAVNVSIAGNDPLPVRVVDAATATPFQVFIMRNPGVIGFPFTPFTVPADKRLVIEYVSGELAAASSCATVPRMVLTTTVGGATLTHYFYPEDTGVIDEGNGPGRVFGLSQETRLYADPGTDVLTQIRTSASPGCGYRTGVDTGLHISGYLVDVP